MKFLPNGLTVFNATPHPLTFWSPEWDAPINAEPDSLINARLEETATFAPAHFGNPYPCEFVKSVAVGTDEGRQIAEAAIRAGADLVVGSIIAAQAYPGLVVSGVACEGYERVPPDQKRIRPDKFVVF